LPHRRLRARGRQCSLPEPAAAPGGRPVIRKYAICIRTSSVALCALAMLAAGCAERKTPAPASDEQPTPAAPAPAVGAKPAESPRVPSERFRALGDEGAPVRIVESTALQCPYCARFAREPFPVLRERYIDTGKVRFESADLPLSMHPYAIPAAIAARCAGEQ